MAQLGCSIPKEYYYFALATPVGMPSQIFLELSGQEYKGTAVQMAEWAEMKPKTPTGVLPYAVCADGSTLAESGAIARAAAAATGHLGEGKDFMLSEQLAGMNADLNKKVMEVAPTMFTLDKFDAAKFAEKKPEILAHLAKYEPFLKGDKFTESGTTFGEIDLFCKLYCYSNGSLPEVVTGKLEAFYKRILELPAVKKLVDGESRYGKLAMYMVPAPA